MREYKSTDTHPRKLGSGEGRLALLGESQHVYEVQGRGRGELLSVVRL